MKKLFFLTALSIALSAASSFGKEPVYILRLQNGTTVKGRILEQSPDGSVRLWTQAGYEEVYPKDQILNVATVSELHKDQEDSGRGYMGIIEAGYGMGVGRFGADRIALSCINGYRFNPHLYAGIGLGLNYYVEKNGACMPVFGHIRSNLLKSGVSPFIALSAGYIVNFQNSKFGFNGFFIEPQIGVSFRIKDRNSITASVSYSGDNFRYYDRFYDNFYLYRVEHKDKITSALCLKVGFTF